MKENIGQKINIENTSRHLAPGVRPIVASYITHGKKNEWLEDVPSSLRNNIEAENVDWGSGASSVSIGSLNSGPFTSILSPLNSRNKYSEGFFRCTSLIVAGKDRATGEQISFLTHQYPNSFLHNHKEEFARNLSIRLKEAVERCEEGTIDAVIVGGNYPLTDNIRVRGKGMYPVSSPEDDEDESDMRKNYVESIKFLAEQVKNTLGFTPMVINGPKMNTGIEDEVYYNTKERRLYFVRPVINQDSENQGILAPNSFPADQIDKQKDNWKK